MSENDNSRPSSGSADAAALASALERVARGDRTAFAYVYQRTSGKLFGACLRILPQRQDAEEALQEVYLTVWRRAASFDAARGSALTWLLTVTRNCAVDRLRSSRRISSEPIALAEPDQEPVPLALDSLVAREDGQRLAACLAELDGGDCLLIRTAFFQGSTYSELAQRAAAPLGTIKSRIRRALLKLRDCLL